MLYVQPNEKGINIKLHPLCENLIYTDSTDDEKSVRIVKGAVIRVDGPSARMQQALTAPAYGPGPGPRKHTLLVEAAEGEVPNYYGEEDVTTTAQAPEQLSEGDLNKLAAAKGLKLVRISAEDTGEAVAGDPTAGKSAPLATASAATDSKKVSK